MTNFGSLLNEWRVAVTAESKSSGKAPLLLFAAVFYSSDYYSLIYPIQAISNSLDWLNVTAYDLYTAAANN
jgi:chitinase